VSGTVAAAVEALHLGDVVVIPTDTVYGLAASPLTPEPVRRLYALKGREGRQPTALVAGSVEALFELLPELQEHEGVVRELLPGPYTLVLPNPAGSFPWLVGERAATIGVRVPAVAGVAAELLAAVGAVAATSANRPGGPDPCRLRDVPAELLGGVAAAVDGGDLPGIASTVLDLTGSGPRVLREGAVPAAAALAAVHRAVVRSPKGS
jgi:L-threonylcarbamoyladenylate synthase